MERALHPELARRTIFIRPGTKRSRLGQMGAMTLVQYTRRGGGRRGGLRVSVLFARMAPIGPPAARYARRG